MKKSNKRARKVEKLIRLTFWSLKSHLPYTYGKLTKEMRETGENKKFQRKCIKRYARTIRLLSRLY